MSARGRDGRDDTRRRPVRDEEISTSSRGGRSALNDFFVDGLGLNREVLQREICKYLGPEAFSRPSTYNGVTGYTITAVRPFTSEMLNDLQELSRQYEMERSQASRRGATDMPSYKDSRTYQKTLGHQIPDDPYEPADYSGRSPYPMPGAQSSYMAPSRDQGYPTHSNPYSGTPYSSGSSYGQGPTYPPGPAYQSAPRPTTLDPYSSSSYGQYDDTSSRLGYQVGTGRDPRDPRELRVEPRGYTGLEPRDDPRNARDPRGEPRGAPSYTYSSGNRPPDPMPYDEYSNPAIPSTRRAGGPYGPSRMAQPSYESRESPQMSHLSRDGYSREPIIEETRRRR